MPEGYKPPQRYYTHHFWEDKKLYRSWFLGGIGGRWLIPQPMRGYRITFAAWLILVCWPSAHGCNGSVLSLYTVRCQTRASIDVLMWRQLQWLHIVPLWPQLQWCFMRSQYMVLSILVMPRNVSNYLKHDLPHHVILYFSTRSSNPHHELQHFVQHELPVYTGYYTRRYISFCHESPQYLQPVLFNFLQHEPQL